MALLFADENFRHPVVAVLRSLGHDVLTIQDANLDNQGLLDSAILAEAAALDRGILTHDRDYLYLHVTSSNHAGIIFCKNDSDSAALAQRIHAALTLCPDLHGQLIRIRRS